MTQRLNQRLIGLWVGYIGIVLLCTALGWALFILSMAGEIYDYQDTVDGVHLPKVDAIVCLAGGRGRIAAAGDVWYRYWELAQTKEVKPNALPVLYLSGMGHQVNWAAVSKQFRTGVLAKLRPQDVVIENESTNTLANATYFAQYAQPRHWRHILLITSSYHMRRAQFVFERVLSRLNSPVQVETLSFYQEPFAPEEWKSDPNGLRVTFLEYLKWIYYRSY